MILSIRDLSFAYRDVPVLQDVSFSMDEGEIVCVVGPNGSGKTTPTVRIIRFPAASSNSFFSRARCVKSRN